MDFRSFMFFNMMQQAQDRLLNERFGGHDLHNLFDEDSEEDNDRCHYEDEDDDEDEEGAYGGEGGARQPSHTPSVTGFKSEEAQQLGPHAWGSEKGRKLREEADVHTQRGDEALKHRHLEKSAGFYSCAIKMPRARQTKRNYPAQFEL